MLDWMFIFKDQVSIVFVINRTILSMKEQCDCHLKGHVIAGGLETTIGLLVKLSLILDLLDIHDWLELRVPYLEIRISLDLNY